MFIVVIVFLKMRRIYFMTVDILNKIPDSFEFEYTLLLGSYKNQL